MCCSCIYSEFIIILLLICRFARVLHILIIVIMLRKIYNKWKKPTDLLRVFERRCVGDWDRYLPTLLCDYFSLFQRSLKNLGNGSVKKIIQFHKQVWIFSGFSFKINAIGDFIQNWKTPSPFRSAQNEHLKSWGELAKFFFNVISTNCTY